MFHQHQLASAPPDIALVVGDVRFYGHRALFANHSDYFRGEQRAELRLPLDSRAFATLVAYIYTGRLDIDHTNVRHLLHASLLLRMPAVAYACRAFMRARCGIVEPIPTRPTTTSLVAPITPQPLPFTGPSCFKPVKREEESRPVLDVACCDGPIRFRKVLNRYYDPDKLQANTKRLDCGGCKDTFKSSSKYRKHTKRHLMRHMSTEKTKDKRGNLQCFQCKTCGSKFPSYYFVHKHRKIHHPNEDSLKSDSDSANDTQS